MDDLLVISSGLVCCSVCVPKDWDAERINTAVNANNPTGISSQWSIADEDFAEGQKNGCACDQFPEARKHWLLTC